MNFLSKESIRKGKNLNTNSLCTAREMYLTFEEARGNATHESTTATECKAIQLENLTKYQSTNLKRFSPRMTRSSSLFRGSAEAREHHEDVTSYAK